MGSNSLYVVQSELNAVVTQLRRSLRLQGSTLDCKDPFLRSFFDLRDVLNSVNELTDVAPIVFVSPFLDVIRSEQTCGSATGQALIAVEKFISYGMFDPHCFTTAGAVQQVADAVTHARFVGTDPSDDEVVLLRILQVLRALLLSKSGFLLSDETVCEILQSCFRICLEDRLSLLLRKTAESCLRDMVLVIFTRLAEFTEDVRHPYVRRWMIRGGGDSCGKDDRRYRRGRRWNYGMQQTSTLTTAERESACTIKENVGSGTLLQSGIDETLEEHPGDAVLDVHTCAQETGLSVDERGEVVKNHSECEASPQMEVVPEPSNEINEAVSDEVDRKSTEERYSEDSTHAFPYGVPCVRELLRFLIALCNPWDKQNVEAIVDLGLSLLIVAFEVGVRHIDRFVLILPLVQNELCRNLISLLYTCKVSTMSSVLRLGFLLFESLREHLKFQLEMYLSRLMELVALAETSVMPNGPPMSGRLATVGSGVRVELRELVLEALVALWRIPGFVTELYLNYDCDLYCSNLFEELTKLLSKNAFPVSTLTTAHVLSLDALLTVVDTIEMTCHFKMINFSDKLSCLKTNGACGITDLAPMQKMEQQSKLATSRICSQRRYGSVEFIDKPPPSHEDLITLKTKKRILTVGSEFFNQQPSKGITYLQEHGILETPCNLTSLVLWLRENPRLNKRKIAEFIVNRKNKGILDAFVRSFDFKNVRLDDALRQFLESFRLPGEAAEISMVIEFFSDHWFQSNDRPFASADAAFTLSYAIIMLNVDQHNPTAKKQQQPMSLEDFVKNLNGVNGGENFDPVMLEKIYHSIRNEEIVMPEEQSGLVRENYLWDLLLQRGWTEHGRFLRAPIGLYDHDLFSLVWGPTVAALSFVFDKINDHSDDAILSRIIGGFRKCAAIAAHYSMCDVFDNLIISLCKFSQLLSADGQQQQQQESNEHFCSSFSVNLKAQMSAKTMFQLVHSHGDILREGWKNIFECLMRCYHVQLLPDAMLLVEDFLDSSGSVSIARRVSKPAKTDSGILSSLYNYLGGGGGPADGRDGRGGTVEPSDAVKISKAIVAECHMELIISDSKYLSGESFSELIKALLMTSASVLADVHHGSGLSDHAEASLIFHTELLIGVALENRDRLGPFWRTLNTHLFSLINDFPDRRFLMERSTVGLLRLAVRLLLRDELKDEVFASVRMLQTVKPASLRIMARQIAYGLHEILRNNAAYVKQSSHWTILFSLLEMVGAAAFPGDLEPSQATTSTDEGIHSDDDGLCSEVSATYDRGCTSDSELYNVSRKQHPTAGPTGTQSTLGQRATSGDWLLVVGGAVDSLSSATIRDQPRRYSANRLLLRTRLRSHDPQAYIKCCDTLAFLIRDMAHVTLENVDSCVQCLRAFIEAGLNGGLHYMDQTMIERKSLSPSDESNRQQRTRTTKRGRSDGGAQDVQESPDIASIYLQLSLQLLDLTYYLLYQASAIFAQGHLSSVDVWSRLWQPLLQALARLCLDRRKVVRSTAMTLLQRSLLVPDLRRICGADWEKCFCNVFFPLLRAMLDVTSEQNSGYNVDEIRVRALTMTSKVFLQHLMPLSVLPSFVDLWMDILGFMERYLQLQSNDIAESVPESIKNMLLVMETAGLFSSIPGLLEKTKERLTDRLAGLADTLSQENMGTSVEPLPSASRCSADCAMMDAQSEPSLEEVVVISPADNVQPTAAGEGTAAPVVLLAGERSTPLGNFALLSPLNQPLPSAQPVILSQSLSKTGVTVSSSETT